MMHQLVYYGTNEHPSISQVEFCMKNGLNVMLAISPKRPEPYSTFKLEQEAFRQLSVVAPRVTDW